MCIQFIVHAPLGTQASVFDVDSAFRCIPIAPEDQKRIVLTWAGLFCIDHNACFGTRSSGGIFGRVADALIQIFGYHGFLAILKWANDFVFFRYAVSTDSSGKYVYNQHASQIFAIADNLGWPWSVEKHTPFCSSFLHIGFLWDIDARTVCIPTSKKQKFLAKIAPWVKGYKFSLKECQSVIGSLNHCCLAIPSRRSHMPSLYGMLVSFHADTPPFVRHSLSTDAVSDLSW